MPTIERCAALLWVLWMCACAPPPSSRSVSVAGASFAAAEPFACMEVTAVRLDHTPPELISALRDCLEHDEIERAGRLLFAFYAFAFYDVERVRDQTAHQVVTAMMADLLDGLPEARKAAFVEHIFAFTSGGWPADLYRDFAALGPPRYAPDYMIAHGMDAILGTVDPRPPAGFDPAAAWRRVLAEKTLCAERTGVE
ncbi:MAG: hypothetical protein KatS3mg121_0660 [Gammaproteobacteria bacterium]|nr:MAG: hypothetical protein KatS3mg121_0660 [Gammaproteobacteria bacterium]